MNQFYFNPFNSTWYEGLPVYLPVKVVVSKVSVGIAETNTNELKNNVEIFPNPFNSSINILYTIHDPGRVDIILYDV